MANRLVSEAASAPLSERERLVSEMVRVAGVEPALLSELDFESSASTNSTTPAQACCWGVVACATFDFNARSGRRRRSISADINIGAAGVWR